MRRLYLIWLLLPLLTACGGTALFSENFNEDTTLPDTLQLADLQAGVVADEGVLRLIVEQTGLGNQGDLILQTDPLIDYTVTARVRITAGQVQLWARVADCAGYGLSIDTQLGKYRLSTYDENCDLYTIDTITPIDVPLDTWYTMELKVAGTSVRASIDGVQFFEVTDAAPNAGMTILRVMTRSPRTGEVDLDEITIYE